MTQREVYLKPNVLAEPLICQWYAWSGLIPPATAAMYLVNSHLNMMQSFVTNPQVHIAALKKPEMLSGPFIHYGEGRVSEIRDLLNETRRDRALLIDFGHAIKQLAKLLENEADGRSTEPLYPKIPTVLKGYVELVYDLNNNPLPRFIEGLLYNSPYYDKAMQSLALSLIDNDDRLFAFNTPRLKRQGQLQLTIPFEDYRLDELFKMRSRPRPLEEIAEMLDVIEEDRELFGSLFTENAARAAAPYSGDSVRVRYFGHACLLIESREVSILCDPLISYEYEGQVGRYTYCDLPDKLDYVLITHQHQDHLMFETLLQLRHKIKNVIVPKSSGANLADPSLRSILQMIGFQKVSEIHELESVLIDDGAITGIPFLGEHADLHISAKTAYQIDLKGRRILCLADSNNIEPRLYDHLADPSKEVDLLFIGMECDGAPLTWVYGPLLTKLLPRKMDQSRRLNGSDCEKVMQVVERLRAKQAYVYAMGQEPWLKFITGVQYTDQSRPIIESDKLVKSCLSKGIVSDRLFGRREIHLTP
ncbi:MAG TPA: MBL fold metallo-hydrolase [Blastocatellia bacterium]|nr:MBL fold metallo-hydrolase [Blastocatellia bacterium]